MNERYSWVTRRTRTTVAASERRSEVELPSPYRSMNSCHFRTEGAADIHPPCSFASSSTSGIRREKTQSSNLRHSLFPSLFHVQGYVSHEYRSAKNASQSQHHLIVACSAHFSKTETYPVVSAIFPLNLNVHNHSAHATSSLD